MVRPASDTGYYGAPRPPPPPTYPTRSFPSPDRGGKGGDGRTGGKGVYPTFGRRPDYVSYGATSGGFQSYQGRRPTSSTPFTHGPPAGSRPGGCLASKGTSSFRGGGGRLGGRGLGHPGHRAPPRPPFAGPQRERAALQYDDASPAGGDFGNGQDAHVNETIPEPGSGERSYDDSYDIGEDEQAEYTQDDFLHFYMRGDLEHSNVTRMTIRRLNGLP